MGCIAINLTGWNIKDDNNVNTFEIPFGTIILSGGYIVFSCDTQKFTAEHPNVTNYIGQLPFNFKNSGDQIRLFKYDNTLFLSVTYSDSWPWPKAADGKGRTLELKDPEVSLDLASNWFPGCPGGSPGKVYFPTCVTTVPELISDVSFHLKILPNPSNDVIRINIISHDIDIKNMSFIMYDFIGNKVKTISSLTSDEIVINRNEFSPGIYIVKIGDVKSFLTEKIIFQ